MFDPLKVCYDLEGMLLSAPILSTCNVVFYRKLRLKKQIDYRTVVTTVRNGGVGRGIIVLEPIARSNQKNVLAMDWVFTCVSLEVPAINDVQPGGPISAYQMAQYVADLIHNFSDNSYGSVNIDSVAIEDDHEFVIADSDGVELSISKRTNFHILGKNTQTPRVNPLSWSMNAGQATIACVGNPTATIYYTLDGTSPVSVGNPSAKKYQNPINVVSGKVLRAAGYLAGFNNTPFLTVTIP